MRSSKVSQLIERMLVFESVKEEEENPGSWIKAIRTEQAMSAGDLGRKLGTTRQSAYALERGEQDGSITLKMLRKAAKAMGMELVYGFAPIDRKQVHPIWRARLDERTIYGPQEDNSAVLFYIKSLIGYHRWAHEKTMPIVKDLTPEDWVRDTGGSFPTLKALYQHMLLADYRWLQRWQGIPKASLPAHYVVEGYESLETLFKPQLLELENVAREISLEGIDEPIHFITGSGLDVTQPFWQTLCQVVNHGTYHRGQVTNALRVLGKQPMPTDIFLFFREDATNADSKNS